MRGVRSRAGLFLFVTVVATQSAVAQQSATSPSISQSDLASAIDALGHLDFDTRTAASRVVRRAPAALAVPALSSAVATHADGYVRFRALVLLTGFNDRQTAAVIRDALGSPNDRLRAVAYSYLEHEPDPLMVPTLLAALEKETGEFVRPALVRALAALGMDPRVQPVLLREASSGQDFFRSAVIEALGEYKARYAHDAVAAIAKLDGPLQDDAALALGRIGEKRGLETLASLQGSAPRSSQPFIAAAICLLGVNCASHGTYLRESLAFAGTTVGFQSLVRSSAAALAAVAVDGHPEAARALFEVGIPSRDPVRAPLALAVGTIALRKPSLMLSTLEGHANRAGAIDLLAEGFDMLEEDFSKERFFAFVRRTYWAAAEGSATRALAQSLIGTLNF